MTDEHYLNKVWPLCFYISKNNKAKWQMNAARALGNQGDRDAVPILIESLRHNPDPLVRGMCAWALGKLAGPKAKEALEKQLSGEDGVVREEIKEVLRSL
jgi:epoxyqueuosine reductase